MKRRPNKMIGYLAVTAGVGCVSSAANAAVVFYGKNSKNDTNFDPLGISLGTLPNRDPKFFNVFHFVNLPSTNSQFAATSSGGGYFTRGADLVVDDFDRRGGTYMYGRIGSPLFNQGAELGRANYANISFNGYDRVYEAVGQFFFDGKGGGYLIAIATTNPIPNPRNLSAVGGTALSISAGKALIDAAAIPEPSGLVLLALGATGLAARRQRRKVA